VVSRPPAGATPSASATPTPPAFPVTSAGLRIGAWANPPNSTGTSAQKIAVLESQIGRRFDISLHYDAWDQSFPSADETDDLIRGRTPEVSWSCGATDASVAAGEQDALISARARQMAAYGAPILLRYKWEFNLAATSNGRTACYDPARDTNGYFNAGDFIAAWQHIRAIFTAQGASNVAFVWNPSGGSTVSGVDYWPGDAFVDWIGIDIYDVDGVGLASTFAGPYALYAGLGNGTHPVIVAETGAMSDQATYLDANSRALLATQFPKIAAVTYFDAVGPRGNWSFTPAGLASFAAFAR
jgi:hypothetical protein